MEFLSAKHLDLYVRYVRYNFRPIFVGVGWKPKKAETSQVEHVFYDKWKGSIGFSHRASKKKGRRGNSG